MKSIIKFALIAFVLISPALASANEALLIIRFNQRNVSYQNQLYTAASEAVKIKPNVIFDVVGYSSYGGTSYAQKIAGDLIKMGVNPRQVNISNQPAQLQFDEVRIFVR